jgi:amino acid transporter
VGAGIYVLTGAVAGRAGVWAPIAFLIASLLAICTARSFAELSSRYPRAGGALVYVEHGLRVRALAVLVGLAAAGAGVISAATVSLGFVAYLSEIVRIPGSISLVVVVVGVGALAAWGVKESVVAAGVATLLEIGGLIAVLFMGVVFLVTEPHSSPASLFGNGPSVEEWPSILQSVVLCFYAFLGFEDMVNVAEEVRDARSVMPRAILWTLAISTSLYVLLATVAVLVVSPDELGRSEAALALVFERSGGSAAALSAVALIAMLNGALVQVVMASRILMSLSRDGALPTWLGRIEPRSGTPVRATFVVAGLVGGLAMTLPMARLASATASVALLVFVLVNVSLAAILLRERRAGSAPPGSISIVIPVGGALASGAFLVVELIERLGVAV